MKYIALLRGINVGGKARVAMSDLKSCFDELSLNNVSTYINSGNVIFESDESDQTALRTTIEAALERRFGTALQIVLVDSERYTQILKSAPPWWGEDPAWKHNLIFLIKPYEMQVVLGAVGELKPGIEALTSGDGVLYQSMLFEKFGKTTTGKLASSPVYKMMTIRNFNTATKLAELVATGELSDL